MTYDAIICQPVAASEEQLGRLGDSVDAEVSGEEQIDGKMESADEETWVDMDADAELLGDELCVNPVLNMGVDMQKRLSAVTEAPLKPFSTYGIETCWQDSSSNLPVSG